MLINPPITFIIRREGEVYRLYSSVLTDFGKKPAENYIQEVGIEKGYAVLEQTCQQCCDFSDPVIEYEIGENW